MGDLTQNPKGFSFVYLVIHLFFVSLSSLSAPRKKEDLCLFHSLSFFGGGRKSSHLFVFYMKRENWEKENKRATSQLLRFFCSQNGTTGFKTRIGSLQQHGNGTGPGVVFEAPFSTKSYPNLSRLRLHWKVSPSYPQSTNGA